MAEVFWVALLTDLATGLGILPFAFFKRAQERWSGLATAIASGMMLSASVFALADKALRRGNAVEVSAGMLAGAAFFAWSARRKTAARGLKYIPPAIMIDDQHVAAIVKFLCQKRRLVFRRAGQLDPPKAGARNRRHRLEGLGNPGKGHGPTGFAQGLGKRQRPDGMAAAYARAGVAAKNGKRRHVLRALFEQPPSQVV